MSVDALPEQDAANAGELALDARGHEPADLAELLGALRSLCAGDFGVRLEPRDGMLGQLVDQVNRLATLNTLGL